MTPPLDPRHDDQGSGYCALVAGYSPVAGRYDELVDSAGEVRTHWRPLLDEMARLGPDSLSRRFAAADQHLVSSGAFYRVYDGHGGADRPYPLSHVPLIITAADWAAIEAGLRQRAGAIEAILSDIYTDGELCRSGRIPGSLVAGSNEYLRPLRGVRPKMGRHLVTYAADIGRDADGDWWVLRDRTQAPSGAGYALENRLALSRALGEIYGSYGAARLAPFFEAFRGALTKHTVPGDARVCLLSPGPLNETYFEHVYLARYLGLRLVEGQDLTVHNNRVYLKTVQGLREVNVIVRRIDADFADPVELDVRSKLGVPGLVCAMRAGNLAMANALGTGVIEASAFLGFLPRLAEHTLGSRLLMPNVATWWCGQRAERDHVLANLDRMIIAPAFAPWGGLPAAGVLHGASLNAAERAALIADIGRRGIDFIGQQPVHLSTTPVWSNGRLEQRPFVLRVFLAASDDGWQVLPGGLALVGDQPDQTVLTLQHGARAADVWVLARSEASKVLFPPDPEPVAIRRTLGSLPSRVADNLFWFGRYLERAEVTLRIVRALADDLTGTEAGSGGDASVLTDLLFIWGAIEEDETGAAAIPAALADTAKSGSVASLIANARDAGTVIRTHFPPDGWRALIEIEALLADNRESARSPGVGAAAVVTSALRNLAAITGFELDNMNRLSGWRFLKLGARIERAILLCRLVRKLTMPAGARHCLDALLEIGGGTLTYRTRYPHGAALHPVLDLVLLDDSNPRGLAFAISRINDYMGAIAELGGAYKGEPPAWPLDSLNAAVAAISLDTLDAPALIGIENLLMQLSDHVTARYFDLSGAPGRPGAKPPNYPEAKPPSLPEATPPGSGARSS